MRTLLLLALVLASTACARAFDDVPPNDPRLAVQIATPPPHAIGHPLTIHVAYKGAPPNAGLVLSLHLAPRWVPKTSGPVGTHAATGPLDLPARPIAGAGALDIRWPAATVGCAPTDAPARCPVSPERYVIVATVIDDANACIVGFCRPPRTLFQAHSAPFDLR